LNAVDNIFEKIPKSYQKMICYRGLKLKNISELTNSYHSYVSVSTDIEFSKRYITGGDGIIS